MQGLEELKHCVLLVYAILDIVGTVSCMMYKIYYKPKPALNQALVPMQYARLNRGAASAHEDQLGRPRSRTEQLAWNRCSPSVPKEHAPSFSFASCLFIELYVRLLMTSKLSFVSFQSVILCLYGSSRGFRGLLGWSFRRYELMRHHPSQACHDHAKDCYD